MFNVHFINMVGDVHNMGNSYSNNFDLRNYLNMTADHFMYLFPCNELEIKGYIASIKSNSPLSQINNLSFCHGVLPVNLTYLNLCLFKETKSGRKSDIIDYRLISKLPSFSKV